MKKSIKDFNLNNKKVIIRVDFNVPVKDNTITDDTRIISALKTIKYAIDNNAKVILLSHMGRIKEENDLIKNDLRIVYLKLKELLNTNVYFSNTTKGSELENMINNLNNKDVLLIQNTRYEDLNNNSESNNDLELAKYWSSLGDIFINDAFGTSHRKCASICGIASFLPSGIGFLIEKEIKNVSDVIDNPSRPFTVILGGAKVSDKIEVVENLLKKADYIIIGGGMSYTFIKSKNINIGKSIVDIDSLDFCKKVLNDKIILPVDTIVTDNIDNPTYIKNVDIINISDNDIGVDIGSKTIDRFNEIINISNTILWNGPMGIFENDKFDNGTKKILENVSNKNCIICGGDTIACVNKFNYEDKITYISTGGGASLELLKGNELVGINCINEKEV